MKVTTSILCLFIVLVVATTTSVYALTSAEKSAIVKRHNFLRSKVFPAAKSMPKLKWDTKLEEIARKWVVQCKSTNGMLVSHNPGRSDTYTTYVGENIYASTAATIDVSKAVDMWYNEVVDYDYATNKCKSGKVCGHYTQVVAARSTKIGCAVHRCTNLRFGTTLVCNYGPGGNFNNQKPYEQGAPNGQTSIYIAQ